MYAKAKMIQKNKICFFFSFGFVQTYINYSVVWCWCRNTEKHQPVKQIGEPRIHAYIES